jgi:hypothetical protein
MLERLTEVVRELQISIKDIDHGRAFGTLVKWPSAIDEDLAGVIAAIIRQDIKLEGTFDTLAGKIGGPGVIVKIGLDIVYEISERLPVGIAERLHVEIDPRIEFLGYNRSRTENGNAKKEKKYVLHRHIDL